jgi:hypothetical protein
VRILGWASLISVCCGAVAAAKPDGNHPWSEPRYFPSGTPIFASGNERVK